MSTATPAELDQAVYTVPAVASVLLITGSANLDKGNHLLCVGWLGRMHDEASIVLADGVGT